MRKRRTNVPRGNYSVGGTTCLRSTTSTSAIKGSKEDTGGAGEVCEELFCRIRRLLLFKELNRDMGYHKDKRSKTHSSLPDFTHIQSWPSHPVRSPCHPRLSACPSPSQTMLGLTQYLLQLQPSHVDSDLAIADVLEQNPASKISSHN